MITSEVIRLLSNKMTIITQPEASPLCLVGPIELPVQLDDKTVFFKWYTWLNLQNNVIDKEQILQSLPTMELAQGQQSSVLVYGDFDERDEALVRMHSICHTGDIFGSKRCDCGFQLKQSMRMIVEKGSGALFYLANHEGRGIGLFSKSLAYLLQQEGYDTVEANQALGFEDDTRSYMEAIAVLNTLRAKPVTLITNNPKKLKALQDYGMAAGNHVSLWGDVSDYNRRYLGTKIAKSGHIHEHPEALTIS